MRASLRRLGSARAQFQFANASRMPRNTSGRATRSASQIATNWPKSWAPAEGACAGSTRGQLTRSSSFANAYRCGRFEAS